ncbi:MAG: thiolase family protein [Thermoplasmata archaeon]|nr:thiolase family protein [Thermoplasmata archaeon]
MAFREAYIPYGGYWSTPFCRWQGNFQNKHAIEFAAEIGRRFLSERGIPADAFDGIILGTTIPQTSAFYGGPWFAGLLGAELVTGPMVAQACATSAKGVGLAAQAIETGANRMVLVACADRCSNGPLLAYPNADAPGATQTTESWVWDNFGNDPFARNSMVQTAENVAREQGITREEQDEVTLLRYEQYMRSTANDREFQKRYMIAPIEVTDARGKKVLATVKGDEGVFPTTADGLAKLKPVLPDGTVTYGSQTHPADGNTGIMVADRETARKRSNRDDVEIRVISYGEGRAAKGFMAKAIVPAAERALAAAGIGIGDVAAVKTHTPFAVNDVYFCRTFDIGLGDMNDYGCSLIYGHPQGPTGSRGIMELVEELVLKGGGYGLFDGCAAGDTGAALVLEVTLS